MRRLVAAVLLAGLSLAAQALPTVEDVQSELAKGHSARAEEMLREVIVAKPGSARAHYVLAEILARNGHFEQADQELAKSKAIDPALHFTQPEKFAAFEQLLAREQAARAAAARRPAAALAAAATAWREPVAADRGTGVPGWVWGLGIAAIAFFGWRALVAKRQPAAATPYSAALAGAGFPAGAAGAAPLAGVSPPYPGPAAPGSGLLGTGLALAGGVAAGMLAEKLLDGRHQTGAGSLFPAASSGLEPGLFDDDHGPDAAARELQDRPVDFGTGDDWGSVDDGALDGGGSTSDDGW